MLAIIFKTEVNKQTILEKVWYVGQLSLISDDAIDLIKFIQVDGHELDHIKYMVGNSGMIPEGRIVKIYGDLAKTIVANL